MPSQTEYQIPEDMGERQLRVLNFIAVLLMIEIAIVIAVIIWMALRMVGVL